MLDAVYAFTNKKLNLAYIGRSHQPDGARLKQHLADAANPLYQKQLAEAIRHDPDGFEFEVLEVSESAIEGDWYDAFLIDGWKLLNVARPNRKQPKARDLQAERAWRAINTAYAPLKPQKMVSYRPPKNPPAVERPEVLAEPFAYLKERLRKLEAAGRNS